MAINWKVCAKNNMLWLAFIPAVLLVVQTVATPFGYQWDFAVLNQQLAAIVNSVFALLTIVGIVADPTTSGVRDSELAMTYEKPKVYKATIEEE